MPSSFIDFNSPSYTLEKIDKKGIKLFQSKKGYRFNSDSVLLSDFAIERIQKLSRSKMGKIADLGSGCGILSILCAKSKLFSRISSYEIQKALFDLTKHNVKLNNMEDMIDVFCKDYSKIQDKSELLSYDFIICNPPYTKKGEGKRNENNEKLIARHEIKVDIKTLSKSFNKILKPLGRVYVVYTTRRLSEFISLMKTVHLEPKTLAFVYHNKNSEAELFLSELVKGGENGLKVLAPIFVE